MEMVALLFALIRLHFIAQELLVSVYPARPTATTAPPQLTAQSVTSYLSSSPPTLPAMPTAASSLLVSPVRS